MSVEVGEMDGGVFQEFCFAFFHIYYDNKMAFKMFGGTLGGATRKGTPDIIHISADGSQVAIQCSVMKTYWKGSFSNIRNWKPVKDISDCINKLQNLKQIIICSSTEIRASNQESEIVKLFFNSHPDISIDIFCLDRIVREIDRYKFKYGDLIGRFLKRTYNYIQCEENLLANGGHNEEFYSKAGYVSLVKKDVAKWNPSDTNSIRKPFESLLNANIGGEINIQDEIIYDENMIDSVCNTIKQYHNQQLSRNDCENSSNIVIQIPFQQIAAIAMLQYVINEFYKPIDEFVTLDICRSSSIHIFRDIEEGIDRSPDVICVNIFNAIQFLRTNKDYLPIIVMPHTNQCLIKRGKNDSIRELYILDRPYASLKFNYLEFVKNDLIEWDTKIIDYFPSKLAGLLKNIDNCGEQYLAWEPLVKHLLLRNLISSEMIHPTTYSYPCIMLAKKSISHSFLMKEITEMLFCSKAALVSSDYLVAKMLMNADYYSVVRKAMY